MRRLIVGLAVLLSAARPWAALGESIVGPDSVPPYKQVRLEAGEPGDDQEWVVFPIGVADGAEMDEAGARFLFTGPPGTYQVLLITVKGGKLSQATKAVLIGEPPTPVPPTPVPPTPVPPGPTPTPVPPTPTPPTPPTPLPDGKYGLASFTRAAVASAAGLTPEQRAKGAAALAGVYRAGASQVAAGAISDPAELVGQTGTRVKAVLGVDYDAWRPAIAPIQARLGELNKGGSMVSVQDFGQAWVEIAAGLEGVK